MPDNKNERNSPDSKRIDVNTGHEVRYWTERFKVSENILRKAVDKVGTSSDAVEKYLSNPLNKII